MYTIDDLRNGKVAVINDGTIKQLREVLKRAGSDALGTATYYLYDLNAGSYTCYDTTIMFEIPTQSVKDFLTQDIHTDIQSLKDKYPQFNITVSVEEKV